MLNADCEGCEASADATSVICSCVLPYLPGIPTRYWRDDHLDRGTLTIAEQQLLSENARLVHAAGIGTTCSVEKMSVSAGSLGGFSVLRFALSVALAGLVLPTRASRRPNASS